MLRLATTSLLCGATVLLAAVYLYFATLTPADPPRDKVLDPALAKIKVGRVSREDGGLRLTLDDTGLGVLLWSLPAVRATDYLLLDASFRQSSSATTLALFWKTAKTGNTLLHHTLPGGVGPALQALVQLGEWQGVITELGFVIRGAPGQTIVLESAQLIASTPYSWFRYTLDEWLAPGEWSHSSINAYYGVGSRDAVLYPLPLVGALLVLSLVSYGLIVAVSARTRFDWRVPAALFVCCWIGLDLLWQGKLLDRLRNTHSDFAGLASADRRTVGPEAPLFAFVGAAKQRIAPDGTRVFVSSADEYIGMRGAYYLYPRNVYWKRNGPELPAWRRLRKGDYLLVLAPTALRFDRQQNILVAPRGERVAVEVETSSAVGTLYRVM